MTITLQQYILLAKKQTDISQLLKLLDEYNYTVITNKVDLEKWKQPILT